MYPERWSYEQGRLSYHVSRFGSGRSWFGQKGCGLWPCLPSLVPASYVWLLQKKLIEFDIEYNVIKWEALNSSQAACGLWTNFGEYSKYFATA
jgi:hypothetical protein